ncbi:hypothetical protein [Enhygromyxa salina]|uniref:hypothetical protein n=1 Tax=Enhygromyxa salina TaxID=215803 RepID=UPI0011B1FB9A|nr:hypothetical protein [Enhygromyxa salina]
MPCRAILGLAALITLAASCETKPGPGSDEGAGTAETAECEPASIIDHQQWQTVEAAADPRADHRPDPVECGIAGWYIENDLLEIDTNYCNYLALRQPSLVAIEAGQTVGLGMYHFDLVAPEPALAHVAVYVEGQLLWEDSVEIPGAAKVYLEEIESPFRIGVGDEVVFHLHNHGQNTWVLQELTLVCP